MEQSVMHCACNDIKTGANGGCTEMKRLNVHLKRWVAQITGLFDWKNHYRLIILSVVILVISILCGCAAQSDKLLDSEPLATIIAGSDFQAATVEYGKDYFGTILTSVRADGINNINEAFICGDMTPLRNNRETSNTGADTVLALLNEAYGLTEEKCVFTLGNHDDDGFDLATPSGGYEKENYSYFVLNETDYGCDKLDTPVRVIADSLANWLEDKSENGYTSPIFILSHVPLHQSGRNDTRYSSYIIDVLNDASDKGLNLFFLFGHNHSSGYDDYLGGSCVFLPAGSTIPVADAGGFAKEHYHSQQINFTYLNAGYIGYVASNEQDSTISSVIIVVYKNRVEFRRYSPNGLCRMKNSGMTNPVYDYGEVDDKYTLLWQSDTTIIDSPHTVWLGEEN